MATNQSFSGAPDTELHFYIVSCCSMEMGESRRHYFSHLRPAILCFGVQDQLRTEPFSILEVVTYCAECCGAISAGRCAFSGKLSPEKKAYGFLIVFCACVEHR